MFKIGCFRVRCCSSVFVLLISTFLIPLAAQEQWQSELVVMDEVTGALSYKAEAVSGVKIPDFSSAGYKGGGVPLPAVPVKLSIEPISGDNTAHIQEAINTVSAMSPDENGIRGAVLLAPGRYEIHTSVLIRASGVVLRGSGRGEDPTYSTILQGVGNTPAYRSIIRLGGLQNTKFSGKVAGTQTNIVSEFVEVGAKKFRVADISSYRVGQNIIVYHPCTQAWLDAVDGGGTANDASWEVGSLPLLFNTRIEKIDGDTIFTNSPVYNSLDRKLSQSYIYRYDRQGLVENSGIEDLRIDIQYPAWDQKQHAKNGIQLMQAENCWVKNCKMLHFYYAGVELVTCNYISVINVHAMDPKGPIDGGYRYNFCASEATQNCLFLKCRASNGRHHYVSNGTTTVAGVVFHDCESIDPYTASEGHRRWTMGLLYDKLRDSGRNPGRVLGLYNRGDWGTGHGWSCANSVAWNCDVSREEGDGQIVIQRPPTAQNFAIGCKGVVDGNGPYAQPTGYIEGTNRQGELVPESLYEAQLYWKMHKDDVQNSLLEQTFLPLVYFNRADAVAYIDLGDVFEDVQVKLYSISGRQLSSLGFSGVRKISCPIEGDSGVYLVQFLIDETNSYTAKLIK